MGLVRAQSTTDDDASSRLKAQTDSKLSPRLVMLRKISSTLNASLDFDNALQMVVKELAVEYAFAGCTVLVIDQLGQHGIVQAHYPWGTAPQEYRSAHLPLERHPALVEVVRTATTKKVFLPTISSWVQRQQGPDLAVDTCSSLILPLVSASKVIGVLLCQRIYPEIRLTEEEALALETVAELITAALQWTKSQPKEDTFSMLAHDLRSPLLMVVQLLGLSTQGAYGPLTPEQQQILSGLRDNCDLLLCLIDDMLDMKRYETGKLVLEKTGIDLPKIIQQSVSLLRPAATDKRIRLETYFGPNIPDLVADEKRIMRVLINLLDNAIRFSPPDEKVVLSCSGLSTTEVLVTVTDTGPCIAKEDQQRIFDKFYQVRRKKAQGTDGVGLGLAFCRETVQVHGGRLWVESLADDHGRGSRFCFTLPIGTPPSREPVG